MKLAAFSKITLIKITKFFEQKLGENLHAM